MDIKPFTSEPIRVLAPDGSTVENADKLGLSKDDFLTMYRWLVFVRGVDDRGYILVRQGRAGFYAQVAGQEAAQVGSALPLLKDDWMYPDHRSQGSMLVKGLTAADPDYYGRNPLAAPTAPPTALSAPRPSAASPAV